MSWDASVDTVVITCYQRTVNDERVNMAANDVLAVVE